MANIAGSTGAMALLNYARQYYEAAEIVFASKPHLTGVIYFLYFHSVELLLKSYLRAHGRKARQRHGISTLYGEARELGLKIGHDDLELQNVVALLEVGNADMAFRYFTLKSRNRPDLKWTRDVVGQLMTVVAGFVESKCDKSKLGVPVRMDIIWRVG